MEKFKCTICEKKFLKKHHLEYHINKKFKCKPINDNILINSQDLSENFNDTKKLSLKDTKNNFTCDYCSKLFSNIYNLKRHVEDYCKEKKQKELDELNKINIDDKLNNNQVNIDELNVDSDTKLILTLLLNQNKKLIENMNLILEENKEFKQKINNLDTKKNKKSIINTSNTSNTSNTNTNTSNSNNTTSISNTSNSNNTNTQINNTINIIAHGKEELKNIELDTIITCLSTFKHREIIPNITKHIYLNDTKPENQNFCVTDMSRNKCKYHDGKKWQIGKSSDKITKIFDNVHNVLTDPFEKENIEKTTAFIKANPKKFNPQFIKVANHYLKSLYDEDDKESIEDKSKVLEELKLIFFNNKDEIMRIKLKDEQDIKK